jgi:hypothetical protein
MLSIVTAPYGVNFMLGCQPLWVIGNKYTMFNGQTATLPLLYVVIHAL